MTSKLHTVITYTIFDSTKHIAYFNNGYKNGYVEDVPINRMNMDKHEVDSCGERILDMCTITITLVPKYQEYAWSQNMRSSIIMASYCDELPV
jgi:hypothetical protein